MSATEGSVEPQQSSENGQLADLPKLVSLLKWRTEPFGPEKSFYLVGTAHVSKKSCRDVEQVIRAVKPQVLMLAHALLSEPVRRTAFIHVTEHCRLFSWSCALRGSSCCTKTSRYRWSSRVWQIVCSCVCM